MVLVGTSLGDPVVGTPCFQGRGQGWIPDSVNYDQAGRHGKKRKKKNGEDEWVNSFLLY